MQHFATQLRPSQQTRRTLRTSQLKRQVSRKRKHVEDEVSDESIDSSEDDEDEKSDEDSDDASDVDGEEDSDEASDEYSNEPVDESNQTHLDVLTTVMHRCLLEGDYHRASRAWGLILRTKVHGGSYVDPRNHGRWGIGAELLLHRNPNHGRHDDNRDDAPSTSDRAEAYTEEGLGLAREYYERFAVRYPYKRQRPAAMDVRTFSPPLFTIWIMDILEQSKWARKDLQRAASPNPDSDSVEETRAREAAIQAEELSSARALCAKLYPLAGMPPYDKLPSWLCLRANVGLWMSDLLIGQTGADDEDVNMFGNDEEESTFGTGKSRKFAQSIEELKEALVNFVKAEENGAGTMDAAKSSIEIKIKYLTKQMARLDE